MNIRKAAEVDALKIAAVAIAVWVDAYAEDGMDDSYSRYVLGRFTESGIKELIRSKFVYVAETSFGIFGFSIVGPKLDDGFEIETMYILSRFHGKGIGETLLGYIQNELAGPFWLKCAEYNPRALNFYRRNGFVDTGTVKFVLDGKDYPCVLMKKST